MSVRIDASVLRGQRGALRRFVDRMRGFDQLSVTIGVPSDAGRDDESGLSMAALAAIHEYGAHSRGIPKRAFLQPSINQNMDKYKRLMARESSGLLAQRTTLNQALQRVGMLAAADVQQYMVSAAFTPLTEQTIKRKGSSKPLIDSGQLRQAVTYKVE